MLILINTLSETSTGPTTYDMLYFAAQHTHVTLKPMQTLKALVKPSPSHAMALMPLGDLGHNGSGKHRR